MWSSRSSPRASTCLTLFDMPWCRAAFRLTLAWAQPFSCLTSTPSASCERPRTTQSCCSRAGPTPSCCRSVAPLQRLLPGQTCRSADQNLAPCIATTHLQFPHACLCRPRCCAVCKPSAQSLKADVRHLQVLPTRHPRQPGDLGRAWPALVHKGFLGAWTAGAFRCDFNFCLASISVFVAATWSSRPKGGCMPCCWGACTHIVTHGRARVC